MKKLVILGVIGLSMVSLVACENTGSNKNDYENFKVISNYRDRDNGLDIYDIEYKPTGCRFAVTDDGITQILGADGKPFCPRGSY
jgi:hypothetical protein